MSNDNGGPAFPADINNFEQKYSSPGMTLRDYFAAKAMVALIGERRGTNQEVAQDAYAFADAMLKERAK